MSPSPPLEFLSLPAGEPAPGTDSITVITLTRQRPQMLARAIASVRAQDYEGPIEHLIVIDGDHATAGLLAGLPRHATRPLRWHLEPRPASEVEDGTRDRRTVYPRLARLLNRGIALATSYWLAFLDDDNQYEPSHLSSLVECAARHSSPAVHSARRMVWPDGSPYLEPLFPGAATVEEGARIYDLMCQREVWIRGTNILQDRVDPVLPSFRNSTVLGAGDPIFLVDQNLWLIRREILLRLPIPEDFSPDDIAQNTCPDDKLLEALLRNGVRIVSSRLPTVRYFLGGVSNGDEQPDRSLVGRR